MPSVAADLLSAKERSDTVATIDGSEFHSKSGTVKGRSWNFHLVKKSRSFVGISSIEQLAGTRKVIYSWVLFRDTLVEDMFFALSIKSFAKLLHPRGEPRRCATALAALAAACVLLCTTTAGWAQGTNYFQEAQPKRKALVIG